MEGRKHKLYFVESAESNKFYVGITVQKLKDRLNIHRSVSKRLKHRMARWMAKYRSTANIRLACDGLDTREAMLAEIFAISYFKKYYNNSILNIGFGGECQSLGIKASPETRAKMSAAAKGKIRTAEHRENNAAFRRKAVVGINEQRSMLFRSVTEAELHFGRSPMNLSRAIKFGQRWKGMLWRFAEKKS